MTLAVLGVVGACSATDDPIDDSIGGGVDPSQKDAGARDGATSSPDASAARDGGSSSSSGAPPSDGGGDAAPGPCSTNPCAGARGGPKCVPASNAAGYQCVPLCDGVSCESPLACNPATGECGNACDEANCAPTEVCIASIHGEWNGSCVDGHQCDCSNCGNCGENGTFVGMQAFCGSPGGAPATMACTKSCGGGGGCIPFGQDTAGNPASICYPLEGCFDTN